MQKLPYFKPFQVVIVGFDGVLGSALTGALDLFSFTGVSWQRFSGLDVEPRFNVQIASLHKKEFVCSNRLILKPHMDLKEVEYCDLLLVPTIGDSLDKVLENNLALITHLKRVSKISNDIASNCSGAFLLAKAGVLNGKTATTHWGYAEKFKRDYPFVKLNEDQLVTQSGNIFCAAGGSAFYDLAILLIERYCGREIANQVAKTQVIDSRRSSQRVYANVTPHKQHHDQLVINVQDFIEEHCHLPLSINGICEHFSVIPRTLNRRFQASIDMRPLAYLQSVRIERAKKLLEQGEVDIKNLAAAVGYEDYSSFNRLFKRITGLSPKEFQNKCFRSALL